jgi:hypothetical protein
MINCESSDRVIEVVILSQRGKLEPQSGCGVSSMVLIWSLVFAMRSVA